MGISALPQTTVRALGASQVLTDPAAVVKELIDNALDANSTSIAIEISSNTIDVIQVRDNGHGVAVEDRPMVARRYCTSKISHDNDLKDIGGSSLGFRGEALASTAELSGSLTITTRVEGDQVAAALKINQLGEVIGQDKASLPVGTNVRITDFIKANPVRRQVVLKNTETCIKKIKRMLQSYAFARPNVRFSLRVLKAKNNKSDWIYAPKAGGNAEDAAFKIVGAACASQCTWSVLEQEGFTLQAFLPRPDAEASKIANIGAFISVDRRPVSAARGVFKQICKAYREATTCAGVNITDTKDPFLFLELDFPAGSYDANLEPGKDDLLFEDSTIVLDLAKRLFATIYTVTTMTTQHQPERPATPVHRQPDEGFHEFVTSLEQHAASSPEEDRPAVVGAQDHAQVASFADPDAVAGPLHDKNNHSASRRTVRSNMYGCDEEDLEFMDARPSTGRTEADFDELRQASKDVTVSNPWVLAKMNASVQRSTPASRPQLPDELEERQMNSSTDIPSSPLKRGQRTLGIDLNGLPTPRPSSPSPPVPDFHPSDYLPDTNIVRDGRMIGASTLPMPQQYSTPLASSDLRQHNSDDAGFPQPAQGRRYNYNSPAEYSANAGTPLSAIPDISSRPRRSPQKQHQSRNVNTAFVPPARNQSPRENVWFDHLQDVDRPRGQYRNRRSQQNMASLVTPGELGDLVDEPRPLTPPRRNRDIRDFVDTIDMTGDAVSASISKHGHQTAVQQQERFRAQENDQIPLPEHSPDPQQMPAKEQRGFMAASELMALEGQSEPPKQQMQATAKRRKTSERHALQELSTNARTAEGQHRVRHSDDEDEYRPQTASRKASRRKSSTKLGRTKSPRLPLERIPPGQGTHDLILKNLINAQQLIQMTSKLDTSNTFFGYNEPAMPTAKGLDEASGHILALAADLHDLLVKAGSDADNAGPQVLVRELKEAFARRVNEDAAVDEEDLLSFG